MSKRRMLVAVLLVSLAAVLLWSGVATAQAEIKIARPLDGATVREKVKILVPAWCVPVDGFVAYYVDNRFRCAVASEPGDQYFAYSWDTKAVDPDPALSAEARRPRDGRHTIAVQVCDAAGKGQGPKKEITVYVKNNASADMPAGGLKLRYNHKPGVVNRYRFKYTLDVKSIQGATTAARSAGEAVEGAEGVIKRSVESGIEKNTSLVRQKLVGLLRMYQSGQPVPAVGISPKAAYHIEDSLGRIVDMITSSSPGTAVTIDLPNLPEQKIRIGDTWTQPEKVFRNALTGEAATFVTTNTLEGLEWEHGFPCAKIRSTFSGQAKIPFSVLFVEPVSVRGETITYFAYDVGKVVSSRTTATADASVSSSIVSALTQAAQPQASAFGSGLSGMTPMAGMAGGGAAGMPTPVPVGHPAYGTARSGAEGSGVPGQSYEQTARVTLEITGSIELAY